MVDYCTLDEVKTYGGFRPDDEVNDDEINDLIPRVSKLIDSALNTTFAPDADEAKYFTLDDLMDGCPRDLWMGRYLLLSVTSITNADGTDVPVASTLLLDQGAERKSIIRILSTSGLSWMSDPDNQIKIVGRWGYSATIPDDIRQACIEWVIYVFHGRDDGNAALSQSRNILPDGKIITALAMTPRAQLILSDAYPYKRRI